MRPQATREKNLLFAIGNSARGDDGLGWAFARAIEHSAQDWEIIYHYQLQIEDADRIRGAAAVVFVDAHTIDGEQGVIFRKCRPNPQLAYTTHSLEPGAVLQLCHELYGKAPPAWELLIGGEQWELGTGLSEKGKTNLEHAFGLWESTAIGIK